MNGVSCNGSSIAYDLQLYPMLQDQVGVVMAEHPVAATTTEEEEEVE